MVGVLEDISTPFKTVSDKLFKPRFKGQNIFVISLVIGIVVVLTTFFIQGFIYKTANKINENILSRLGITDGHMKLLHNVYLIAIIDNGTIIPVKSLGIKTTDTTVILEHPGFYVISLAITKGYLELNGDPIAGMDIIITTKINQIMTLKTNESGKLKIIYLGNA